VGSSSVSPVCGRRNKRNGSLLHLTADAECSAAAAKLAESGRSPTSQLVRGRNSTNTWRESSRWAIWGREAPSESSANVSSVRRGCCRVDIEERGEAASTSEVDQIAECGQSINDEQECLGACGPKVEG